MIKPSIPVLGRLEQVDLRSAWESEPMDFTPWLAQPENIALLGEAVGIQLEVEAQEKKVGPFSADILCRDATDGHFVLIENQLERTDHLHLGQLLTDAAGLDAVTIIWIARRFADEHRAALDWLNNSTSSGLNFFGLEVELWKIGESARAPKFNVVCKPNDWTTAIRQRAAEGPLTEDQQRRLDFWSAFKTYLDDAGSGLVMSWPSHSSYAAAALEPPWFRLMAGIEKNGTVARVFLQISGPDKQAFYALIKENHQRSIEERLVALGRVDWRDLVDAKESQVSVARACDLSTRESWPELHVWLAAALAEMRDPFVPIVTSLHGAVPEAASWSGAGAAPEAN